MGNDRSESSRNSERVDLDEHLKIKKETLQQHNINLHNGRTQKFTIRQSSIAGQSNVKSPVVIAQLTPAKRHIRMEDNIVPLKSLEEVRLNS